MVASWSSPKGRPFVPRLGSWPASLRRDEGVQIWDEVVFLMRFDYELADESRKFLKFLLVPNRNDAQVCVGLEWNWPSLSLFRPRVSRFVPSEGPITWSSRRLWNRWIAMHGCPSPVFVSCYNIFLCRANPLISQSLSLVLVTQKPAHLHRLVFNERLTISRSRVPPFCVMYPLPRATG